MQPTFLIPDDLLQYTVISFLSTHLRLESADKVQEVKLCVVDEVEGLTDDAVDALLGSLQKGHQPHLNKMSSR